MYLSSTLLNNHRAVGIRRVVENLNDEWQMKRSNDILYMIQMIAFVNSETG